jgi:hypothetical protein
VTSNRFAAAYCSNHQEDGSCLGATITKDGHIPPLRGKPACKLAAERCAFFEECVLPYAKTCWRIPDQRLVQSIKDVANQYRLQFGLFDAPKRACPDCGNTLEKGKQRCQRCAEKQRKEANRLRIRRWRQRATAGSGEMGSDVTESSHLDHCPSTS